MLAQSVPEGLSQFCSSAWKNHTAEQPNRQYLWVGSYFLIWMRRIENVEIQWEGRNLSRVGWWIRRGSDFFSDTVRMQLLAVILAIKTMNE